jgi:hypothetical protein
LRQGDVLTAAVDVEEVNLSFITTHGIRHCDVISKGWCDVTLSSPGTSDEDVTQHFDIPVGSIDEYLFAMTFANDHRATIIENDTGSFTKKCQSIKKSKQIGPTHRNIFGAFMRRLIRIADSTKSTPEQADMLCKQWEERYGNSVLHAYVEVQTVINSIIPAKIRKISSGYKRMLMIPLEKSNTVLFKQMGMTDQVVLDNIMSRIITENRAKLSHPHENDDIWNSSGGVTWKEVESAVAWYRLNIPKVIISSECGQCHTASLLL